MQSFAIATFLACLALCVSQSNGDILNPEYNVRDKEDCVHDVEECASGTQTFKCAMMFNNLTDLPIKVIDMIPDILDHSPNEEILEELEKREINYPAFKIDDVCPSEDATGIAKINALKKAEKRANARCYAFLNDYTKNGLDTCDSKLVEAGDTQTIGDALCERAYESYEFKGNGPKFWFAALIDVGAHVSYCGRPWQPVKVGKKPLTIEQKLCCVKSKKSGGKVVYKPCNGSAAKKEDC